LKSNPFKPYELFYLFKIWIILKFNISGRFAFHAREKIIKTSGFCLPKSDTPGYKQ